MEAVPSEPLSPSHRLSDPALPQVGTIVAGRYRITANRGAGMMGVVVEAVRGDGERVALKILRPEVYASPEIRARLAREAAIVFRLASPHVVRVFDYGETAEGLPFFAMELLEGADLYTLAQAGHVFSIAEAVSLIRQACAGVAEAHALGVVHRDLKPQNLFLARGRDGVERLKVLDFGISKVVGDDAHLTATQTTLGTPAYMSPEHVRSARTIDARSDVWALGVVLFELLTQRLPFGGESAHAVIAAIIADEPLRLRALRPDIPGSLEAIVHATLVKDPARRIASVTALSNALAPHEGYRAPPGAGHEEATIVDLAAQASGAGPGLTELGTGQPMPGWSSHRRWDSNDAHVPTATPSPSVARLAFDSSASPSPDHQQTVLAIRTGGGTATNALHPAMAGSMPITPASSTPVKPAASPFKIVALATAGTLATIALVAMIWVGSARRRSAEIEASGAAPTASASEEMAGPTVLATLAARDPETSWDACILRADGRMPAIHRPAPDGIDDLDERLAHARPRLVLDVPGSAPSDGVELLRLAPITPISRAIRRGPTPVLLVTDQAFWLGLEGDRILDDVSTEEAQRALSGALVKTAPGWIVVAEGSAPLSRLRAALELLSDASGSVVLAVPIANSAPSELPLPPDDGLSCSPQTRVAAKELPEDATAAQRTSFEEALLKAADACRVNGHDRAGSAIGLVVRAGRSGPSVCIEHDEIAERDTRRCLVESTTAAFAQLARLREPTRFTARLDGPLVRALCR